MTNQWCPNIFENSGTQRFSLFGNDRVASDKGLGRFVVRVEEIGVSTWNPKHPDFPLVLRAFHMRHNCDQKNASVNIAYI